MIPRALGRALVVLCSPLVWYASTMPIALACDSTACLLATRGRSDLLSPRGLRLDLSFRYTDQSVFWDGDHQAADVLRPKVDFERRRLIPDYHGEQGGHESFLQADAAYGLFRRMTVLLSVPLMAHRNYNMLHSQFAHVYTTNGYGDAVVGARFAVDGEGRTVAGLAVKTPTGKSRLVSAFDRGIYDPSLQPGTGSWDYAGSLRTSRRAAGIDWTGLVSYQLNTTNGLGYRFGNDRILSLTAARPIGSRLSGSLQAKSFHRGRSRFLGQPVPTTGGTITYLNPGLSANLPARTSPYVYLQLPVHRRLNESQLAPRVGVLVGLSRTF